MVLLFAWMAESFARSYEGKFEPVGKNLVAGVNVILARTYGSALRQVRTLTPYSTRQKRLAGINPHCAVWSPMMQTTTLFIAASAQPSQHRLPIRIVEVMVKTQDK